MSFLGFGGVFAAPQLVQFWLLPLVVGQPFLQLFLLAEHTGCPHNPDMLRNSRTIRTHPLVMMLAWNMPYHTAHHSLPAVPFHQLAAFNDRPKVTLNIRPMVITASTWTRSAVTAAD